MRDEDDPYSGAMILMKKEVSTTSTFLFLRHCYMDVLNLDVGATVCVKCLMCNMGYCDSAGHPSLSSHPFVIIESIGMVWCVLRSQKNDLKATRHNGYDHTAKCTELSPGL